jgi:hypothetical protein
MSRETVSEDFPLLLSWVRWTKKKWAEEGSIFYKAKDGICFLFFFI